MSAVVLAGARWRWVRAQGAILVALATSVLLPAMPDGGAVLSRLEADVGAEVQGDLVDLAVGASGRDRRRVILSGEQDAQALPAAVRVSKADRDGEAATLPRICIGSPGMDLAIGEQKALNMSPTGSESLGGA